MLNPETVLQKRYLIVDKLGEGGMGVVYLAKDGRLQDTLVVVKELEINIKSLTDEPGDIYFQAFKREACILANLNHPALPKVMDLFQENNRQYFVMQFIKGRNLLELLKDNGQPFHVGEVLRWGHQLLDALEYLHNQNPSVIHRDIKPANIKLTDKDKIVLLDFGLAKGIPLDVTEKTNLSYLTEGGGLSGGSREYAPPEQLIGNASTDPRSDLYSFAATLYHLLTGRAPIDSDSRIRTIYISENRDPLSPLNKISPNVPPRVAAVLMKAMSLRREDRQASAAVLQQELQDAGNSSAWHSSKPSTALHIQTDDEERTLIRPAKKQILTPPKPQSEEDSSRARENEAKTRSLAQGVVVVAMGRKIRDQRLAGSLIRLLEADDDSRDTVKAACRIYLEDDPEAGIEREGNSPADVPLRGLMKALVEGHPLDAIAAVEVAGILKQAVEEMKPEPTTEAQETRSRRLDDALLLMSRMGSGEPFSQAIVHCLGAAARGQVSQEKVSQLVAQSAAEDLALAVIEDFIQYGALDDIDMEDLFANINEIRQAVIRLADGREASQIYKGRYPDLADE